MQTLYIHTKIGKSLNKSIDVVAKKTGQNKCDIINNILMEGIMAKKKAVKKSSKAKPMKKGC